MRHNRPAGRPLLRSALRLLLGTPVVLAACDLSTSDPFENGNEGIEGFFLEPVVQGLSQPVFLTSPPGDPRLFVVERTGAVLIVTPDGSVLPTPFLDLSQEVTTVGSEQGLLGLAFHPDYADNGRFFVDYTDVGGDTRVVEYMADPTSDVADAGSASLVLHVEQPFANHNGGQVSFGPDGMLYIGLGDGGSGGDPNGNGQNLQTLLGTILRIDVDGAPPYEIPADNPFVSDGEARAEIWAYGLRNPWRFAWDPAQSLFYIADVGQDQVEEVNIIPSANGGVNYGWRIMEGGECFLQATCIQEGLHLPEIVYSHELGCSVTGGVAYRGSEIPTLAGRYLFADFCDGWIRAAAVENRLVVDVSELEIDRPGSITSFGVDADGEVYVLVAEGTVFKLVEDIIGQP